MLMTSEIHHREDLQAGSRSFPIFETTEAFSLQSFVERSTLGAYFGKG